MEMRLESYLSCGYQTRSARSNGCGPPFPLPVELFVHSVGELKAKLNAPNRSGLLQSADVPAINSHAFCD